jgi:uroporphyrinogen decarboxylase
MKMTHKQRVMNLLKGKPIDRLPSDVWLSDRASLVLSRELGVSGEELMQLLDNHLIIVAALDNHKCWDDPICLEKALQLGYFHRGVEPGIIFDDWGVGWDTAHEGIYEVFHPLGEEPDIDRLRVPDPRGPHLFDVVNEAADRYGEEYCVVGCQDLTLFERACALRGFDTFLVDLKENPRFAENLLDAIADYQVELARGFVSRGVDIAFTGGDYGTQQGLMVSVDDWLRFEAPRLRRIWEIYQAKGIPILHHSCGNILDLIPHLISMGLNILNPIQHVMQAEALRDRFGDSLVLFGGVDSQELMTFGTPEQIAREVERYIRILGHGKGYIVAPDQCLLSNVPAGNVIAFVHAVARYGENA